MLKVASFGEIIINLMPYGVKLFSSVPGYVEFQFSSPEITFLANIVNLGAKARLISAIPNNSLGIAVLRQLDKYKISRRFIKLVSKGRIGINFVEEISSKGKFSVIRDSEYSILNKFRFEDFNFKNVFSISDLFHITSTTCALSRNILYIILNSVKKAKELGLEVSCDLKYQNDLWNYKLHSKKVKPKNVMGEILEYCDYLFCNDIAIKKFFNIKFNKKPYKTDHDSISYYENLLLQLSKLFPHIKVIILLIKNPSKLNSIKLGGMLYIRQINQFLFSPCYYNKFMPILISAIKDKRGIEQAFSAGFIYAYKKFNNLQCALDYAVYYTQLKYSYYGEINLASFEDVLYLMNNNKILKE